jgi:hypothetical protein
MKLITFAMSAVKSDEPAQQFLARLAGRVADSVQPTTAHVVGAASGATGIALWSELAKHLTIFTGLLCALMAFLGGGFYATYWAIKAMREWQEFRATGRRRK